MKNWKINESLEESTSQSQVLWIDCRLCTFFFLPYPSTNRNNTHCFLTLILINATLNYDFNHCMCFCSSNYQQHIQTLISALLFSSQTRSSFSSVIALRLSLLCSKSRISNKELILTNTPLFVFSSFSLLPGPNIHVSSCFSLRHSLPPFLLFLPVMLWLQVVWWKYLCAHFWKERRFSLFCLCDDHFRYSATDWVRRLRVGQMREYAK